MSILKKVFREKTTDWKLSATYKIEYSWLVCVVYYPIVKDSMNSRHIAKFEKWKETENWQKKKSHNHQNKNSSLYCTWMKERQINFNGFTSS